jgi:glycosyltransferase involved in cell wall biosynthesis
MIQLVRLLRESGNFNIHVACLSGRGKLRPKIDAMNFSEVPEFPLTSFYDRNMVKQLRRFSSYLRERKIDIVHTHDFYSNIFGITGARLGKVKARVGAKRETLGMRTPSQVRVELLSFKLADAIVVNAEAVKSYLIQNGVASHKPIVIHNGLDIGRFPLNEDTSAARQWLPTSYSISANGQRPRLVTIVANMHHDVKNHPMFLRAAKGVANRFNNVAFLLIGEGPLSESFQQLANELGIADKTLFLGDRPNVPEILRASDVCVLSSTAEGFSNSILEYMAASKPVVVTEVGGAAEVVVDGETGYLVKSNDDQMMSERILSLLQNEEAARQMGAKGRALVEDKFSCAAQLRKTEELYERLLRR